MHYQDNFYSLCGYSALGLLCLYLTCKWLNQQLIYYKSEEVFNEVKETLKTLRDSTLTHGMLEDDVKEVLRSHAGSDGAKTMWPVLERMRAADPRVCKFPQLSEGRPAVYWQWKGSNK